MEEAAGWLVVGVGGRAAWLVLQHGAWLQTDLSDKRECVSRAAGSCGLSGWWFVGWTATGAPSRSSSSPM